MATISIKKERIEKGIIILPIKEYQKLLAKAVPTYYLTGKEAEGLDKLVKTGLKEYKAGKVRRIRSFADMD